MNFVAFSHFLGDGAGQIFVFFILTVAAAEAAIGLAILVVLFRNRQTINVAEKVLPLTVSSNLLTANYANGAVFFVSNLTAAANWECLVTNVNPTSSTGCSNVITLLIVASVYQTFAATCKINGTTRTLQFAEGIDAVDMTGATTICQTISVVYSGGSGVPIAVLSSVVPFF